MAPRPVEESGQLYTLGLIEELRSECKRMWGASSELYFRIDELLRQLANPNLHEIFPTTAFQVELWDRYAQHVRWVVAATASITIGNAAFDAAIREYSGHRLALRKGILVIREHAPKDPTGA